MMVMYTEKVVDDPLSFLVVSKERAFIFVLLMKHEAKVDVRQGIGVDAAMRHNRHKMIGCPPFFGSWLKCAGPHNPDWVVADRIVWSN